MNFPFPFGTGPVGAGSRWFCESRVVAKIAIATFFFMWRPVRVSVFFNFPFSPTVLPLVVLTLGRHSNIRGFLLPSLRDWV